MKLLDANQSYTFSKIFELKISCQDLADEFDYIFSRKRLNLSHYQGELDNLTQLQSRLNEILPYFDLANETSRREVLISPIISELVHYTKCEVRIEYLIKATDLLQGYLDYFIKYKNNLVIIEAKKADLDYGMTQLFAELIALDTILEENQQSYLVGAVTTGKIWEFAQLDRIKKHLTQGLESYRVPEDLDPLLRILVQCLIQK
ncbi:MAG: hypothetical protein AB4058_20450 [Microcystaceae cyanobacterium]